MTYRREKNKKGGNKKMELLIVREGLEREFSEPWIELVRATLVSISAIKIEVVNTVREAEECLKTRRVATLLFSSEVVGEAAERIAKEHPTLTVIVVFDDPAVAEKLKKDAVWINRFELARVIKLRQVVLQ